MAEYKNKAPDSPKGKCFTAFKEGGADAARKLAAKMGTDPAWADKGGRRAPKRIEDWLIDFGATEPTPSSEKPVSEPRKRSTPAKKLPVPSVPKRRVYDVGEPNVHGVVVSAGEQVSVVKWDVPSPWGKECSVSNEQLKDVESEPSRQDRYAFLHAVVYLVMKKDERVGQYKTFTKAADAAADESLWVFAKTKGGSVALLMRPHWDQYRKLEAAKKESAA